AARGDACGDQRGDGSVARDGLHHHVAADRGGPGPVLHRPRLLSAHARQPARLVHARLGGASSLRRQSHHSPADGDRMNALPLVIGIAAALGAYLLTMGIIASRAADPTALARERLARQEVGLGQSAVALQLEKPFLERLFEPTRRWLNRQMPRMTPEAQAANLRRQLDFVGNPLNLDPPGLQTLRIAGAAGLGAIGTATGIFFGTPVAIGVSLLIGVAAGFYLPVIWLDQLVRQR